MGYLTCGNLDLRDIPESEKIVIGSDAWIKAEVSEKIYYYGNNPCCVITLGQAVYGTLCPDTNTAPAVVNQTLSVGTRKYRSGGNNSSGGTSTEPVEEASQADKAVDTTSMNKFGYMPTCVVPQSVVIPMRSNVRVYGPYVSSNWGSNGGSKIEKDSDLCPWAFGGYAGMNAAGREIANSSTIGLVKAESGSATIPGFPTNDLTYLGAVLGASGPCLTDLNFSYGATGVTTSYNFKTFTPKNLSGVSRNMIDKMKSISKYRNDQIKFLRSQQIDMNKIGRKLSRSSGGSGGQSISNRGPQARGSRSSNSLQRLLVGESVSWHKVGQSTGKRIVVGTVDLNKSGAEMKEDFGSKAYMSLDAFFTPVSKYGDGGFSPYAAYSKISSNRPLRALPPIGKDKDNAGTLDQYALAVNRKYFDPLTGAGDDAHTEDGTTKYGHTIDYAGHGSQLPKEGILASFKKPDDPDRYPNDYRFFALRGPLVLQQWGYDTDGKPIPNGNDTDGGASSGSFTTADLKDEFLEDFLAKPQTWPVAPVDLRFDRERGVWTCAPEYQLLIVQLTEKLSPKGKAKARVESVRGKPFYDDQGEYIDEPHIEVHDKLGISIEANKKCFAYYDPNTNQYMALSASGGGGAIRFKGFVTSKTDGTTYGDDWTAKSGFGDRKPKTTNFYGVRVGANGGLINAAGESIGSAEMQQAWNNPSAPESSGVFVRIHTMNGSADPGGGSTGLWGASFGYWNANDASSHQEWENYGLNGYAVEIDNPVLADGTEVDTGGMPAYDAVFMESYATFIRGKLQQKLYLSQEEASNSPYYGDDYKTENPNGNASISLEEYWGPSGNRMRPQFRDSTKSIPVRVFDPYDGEPDSKYKNLANNDMVIAVFNNNNKKYYIVDANNGDDTKVIKFGVAEPWVSRTYDSFTAVRVDVNNKPIDEAGERITGGSIASEDTIRVVNTRNSFGPAAGSNTVEDFDSGVEDGYGNKSYMPFVGFALERASKNSSGSGSSITYECIWLQHFATHINGKCGSHGPVRDGSYLGIIYSWSDGIVPIAQSAPPGPDRDGVWIDKLLSGVDGNYFCGRMDGNDVDGCEFVATLLPEKSENGYLYYGVIENQVLAKKINFRIQPNQGSSDTLINNLNTDGYTKIDGSYMNPRAFDGFWWSDQTINEVSESKLYNKDIWTNKRLLLPSAGNIRAELVGYNPNDGTAEYSIVDAPTIAKKGYGKASGKFLYGIPPSTKDVQSGGKLLGIRKENYSIQGSSSSFFNSGFFYADGIPFTAPEKMFIYSSRTWMTFSGSEIAIVYNDTADPSASQGTIESDGHYRIIEANEVPVIVTAKADSNFAPGNLTAYVTTTPIYFESSKIGDPELTCYSSCYKGSMLIRGRTKVYNPLRFGALAGDTITLQRVCLDDYRLNIDTQASYAYIIIGTSDRINTP